jgi:transposase
MKKIDARKLSTDAKQQIRYQIIRLRKQGRKHEEISAITGVHRSNCVAWWNRYNNNGIKALNIKSAEGLSAVAGDWIENKKKKSKRTSAITVRIS